MTEFNFIKIVQAKAQLIAAELELTDKALTLLEEGVSPAEYIQQLMTNELYIDVIMFLSAGLSKRESTWWACLCARSFLTDTSSEFDIKAIELAEAWVYKPTPENCKVTLLAAEATEFKSAAGWAAIAAFWSGDDISPNDKAVIPPPADLTAKAVNGAILLAAVQVDPTKVVENQKKFIMQGIDIANGGDGRNVK